MRPAKGFRRRGNWYFHIGPKKIKLGPISPGDGKNLPRHLRQEMDRLLDEAAAKKNLTGQTTVALAFDQYLEQGEKRESTKSIQRYRMVRFLRQYGSVPVSAIGISAVRDFQKAFQGKKGSYHNCCLKTIQAFFNWMIVQKMVASNPFNALPLKPETKRKRYCKPHEFQALLRVADLDWKRKLFFMYLSGCRPQDLYQARWDWIEEGRMIVPEDCHKTGSITGEVRVVYLPKLLQRLLAKIPRTAEFIFPGESKQRLCDGVKALRRAAGIGPDKNGEELTPYCLRHAVGTKYGTKSGVAPATVMKLMGHKRMATTMRYIHVEDDDVREMIG